MPVNHVAENVFGTIGTILWCVQIVPQIVVNYRRKDTVGLSPWLMFIWSSCSVFLGAYCIVQNINIPIIVQPQLFGFLSGVCWMQCLYYNGPRYSKPKALAILTVYFTAFAGLEVALVYGTRAAGDNQDHIVLAWGIISAAMLMGGLIPQYYEIYKFREVIGLSLVFMSLDCSGALFCTLSLIFKKEFDALAAVNYLGILVLDAIILALAAILNPRAKRRKARKASRHGETGDTSATAADGETTSFPSAGDEATLSIEGKGRDVGAIAGVFRQASEKGEMDEATPRELEEATPRRSEAEATAESGGDLLRRLSSPPHAPLRRVTSPRSPSAPNAVPRPHSPPDSHL